MNSKAWIQTYHGGVFHLLDPQPEEILIEDIAHALAMQCRFTGHTRWHYSVAQHSIYASQIVQKGFELEALLHDGSEAYIADLSRPLKHYTEMGTYYIVIEERIQSVLARKFGVPEQMSPEVKAADNALLYAEKAALMPPMEWDTRWGDGIVASITIEQWTPEEAEGRFLRRYAELREIIG